MTNTIPPCEDVTWSIAAWMAVAIKERELTASFNTPNISVTTQDTMRDELALKILTDHSGDSYLQALLGGDGEADEDKKTAIRDAIDLLARGYSACSSVYPKSWFHQFRRRMQEVGGLPVSTTVAAFMPPMPLLNKEAVA